MDEGFARNIRQVFGPGDLYEGLADRPLESVTIDAGKDYVTFAFEDGHTARYAAEGDCCSSSWIEELTVPDSVKGRTLVGVQDYTFDNPKDEADNEYEVLQSYKTVFHLDNGETITIEYRNSSNGYYGGYLVRA